ncbi:MAG: hypothetical protein AAFO83_00915 [Cyanobacteria bacterium J06607_13]
MALLKPDYDRLIVADIHGRPRRIKICAAFVEELIDLKDVLADALDEVLASYDNSFAATYTGDARIRGLCDRVIELAGLEAKQLDINLLVNLVFGWHDATGEFHEGIIFRLARGEVRQLQQELQPEPSLFEDDETLTPEQYICSLRTRIVTLDLAQDIEGADHLLARYTADELEIMIDQRFASVDPKGYKKAQLKKAAKEAIREGLSQSGTQPAEPQDTSSQSAAQRTLEESLARTMATLKQKQRNP